MFRRKPPFHSPVHVVLAGMSDVRYLPATQRHDRVFKSYRVVFFHHIELLLPAVARVLSFLS